ncbi:hypothetical protein [Acanthopleuribacter pedis]|uniref:Transmembrane protein n=1 Tax=Acanthopleuribacter pedis TaxID=442870 RepID=A0A8J7Q1Z2_9BACT|nr:hypothetical protein [Acanthopleuribacter pedis]MBO1318997.1 hypothetical protein [Acanthopleuribacter pedis]
MAKSVKVPKKTRWFFYAVLATSFISGLTFFILNRWVTVEGEFGPEKHPWQMNVLRLHGAGAFLMMVFFGYFLASHVQVSWPVKPMRPLGIALTAAVSLMILSAYSLYYLGDMDVRAVVAYVHTGLGVTLPFFLIAHLVQGSRRRNSRKVKHA